MRKEVIEIGIMIFSVSMAIFFVKNHKNIIEKIKEFKIIKFFNLIILFIMIMYLFISINSIKSNIDFFKDNLENQNKYAKYSQFIKNEREFYSSIIELDYNNQNYNNPYIPEGFLYIEGEWNTGFVIEDEKENQYVWVPCSNNNNNSNAPMLDKRYFSTNPLISIDECYDIEYESFLRSALENGGFYVSRYEIGSENNEPLSKKNIPVLNNIIQKDAIELSKRMYHDALYKCELINGYAYDTLLQWVMNTNKYSTSKITTTTVYYTGRDSSYNNIYDLFDNVLELTSEKCYDTNIERGFYLEDYFEKYGNFIEKNENRFSILENESNNYTSFRTIIYKK